MKISQAASKKHQRKLRDVKYVSLYSSSFKLTEICLVGRKHDAQIHQVNGASRKIDTKVSFNPHIIPMEYATKSHRWELGCRRLTPGRPYLEAIQQDNVSIVTTSIQGIVENGIETSDGEIHQLDAIVCATGFDTSFVPGFDLFGIDDRNLRSMWAKSHAEAYMGLAVSGFPNYWSKPATVSSIPVEKVTCSYSIQRFLGRTHQLPMVP
jgi:cation diffusion facilitator CzcD-associated flavoprotein CzcO